MLSTAHATVAEKPIEGGLGIKLMSTLPPDRLGSELEHVTAAKTPDNRESVKYPALLTGQMRPWRYLLDAKSPRPLRQYPATSYVMLDEERRVIRVLTQFEYSGCGTEVDWLVATIGKKYHVTGDLKVAAPKDVEAAFRATFSGTQIDISCGRELIVDYADYHAIQAFTQRQAARVHTVKRADAILQKRELILHHRRANRFADQFTLGDQFRLQGAFGIYFKQPFARNSTQKFPIDTPFIAALPGLPPEFENGEISLELSPERAPIIIRGIFDDLAFERLAQALKAKYGTPLKASPRHVIHKVGGNHAIIKKFSDGRVELAFIDTAAQAAQRNRRWEQESEGV